ncbi:putative sensor domain DACNV-containing protein [Chondromyces apiculatus]|uniref:Probable sensor domain-containing protein n=1 Tax=Chondromyces apiculatus DSM 436 TaxID=1192034 RepID=A0A017T0G6_9BACT|nr:hypothetical protein [Chondromyces apiculatus]EYF02744.1 Hypothetical protein CAP_6479 [Chondromyces apiculatus DSM 436]
MATPPTPPTPPTLPPPPAPPTPPQSPPPPAPSHAYPADLARFLVERLHPGPGDGAQATPACPPPDLATLEALLSTAYQATLLREEERPVTFRLVFCAPEAFPSDAGPPSGLQRLELVSHRPYTPHALRRIAPAAPYARALIGVHLDEGGALKIWGILQSGPLWLRSAVGGRGAAPELPSGALVVRGFGPGLLAVDRDVEVLGELRGGSLAACGGMDIFTSRWFPAAFSETRGELIALHAEAERCAPIPWTPLGPEIFRQISQQMVKRIIATMQVARHGGTVLLLPPELTRAVLEEALYVKLKYRFRDAEPRRRFRSLILSLMSTLAQSTPPEVGQIDWDTYERSRNPEVAALDEAIFEMAHLTAGLADVDGAVVMTKRFELLGFGGEIGGGAATLTTVRRALDLEGAHYELEPVDWVGTRHRSAYRLCHEIHGAVAIVASHDGGIRIVAWKDGAVTYWDHVPRSARER